jgi:septal ring factor EnvC (AmiA/AmiB activator)
MAKPIGNSISARFWRLPGQLLLALINATAILLTAAAILTLLALSRIDRFAENVTGTMTAAVLSKIDLPSKDVLANIRELTAELRAVRATLREARTDRPTLQPELARLNERLAALNAGVDRLTSARSMLSDEAIRQLGASAADAVTRLKDARSRRAD